MNTYTLRIFFFLLSTIPLCASLKIGPKTPIHSNEDLQIRMEEEIFQQSFPRTSFEWLPPQYESAAKEYLIEKSGSQETRVKIRAKTALVGLRHQETIESVVADYKREDETAAEILKDAAGSSDLLQPLIPIFYTSSVSPRKNQYDQDILDSKTHVSDIILKCISTVDGFPEETKNWAMFLGSTVPSNDEDPKFYPIWLLQQFLENNREAIASKDYAKATRLPTFEGQIDRFQYEWRSLPNYIAHIKDTQELVKHQTPVNSHLGQFTERPSRRPPAKESAQASTNVNPSNATVTESQSPVSSRSLQIGFTTCIAFFLTVVLWTWNTKRKVP